MGSCDRKEADELCSTWKALIMVRWSLFEFLDSTFLLMSAIFSLPWEKHAAGMSSRVCVLILSFHSGALPGVWRRGPWSWAKQRWWGRGRGSPAELRKGWVCLCEAPRGDGPGGNPAPLSSLHGPAHSDPKQTHRAWGQCFHYFDSKNSNCTLTRSMRFLMARLTAFSEGGSKAFSKNRAIEPSFSICTAHWVAHVTLMSPLLNVSINTGPTRLY